MGGIGPQTVPCGQWSLKSLIFSNSPLWAMVPEVFDLGEALFCQFVLTLKKVVF